MKYRTQVEVADRIRRIADGSAAADPLSPTDRAELEQIAQWVEERSELQAELRCRLERAVVAAYSLGTRHVLGVRADGPGGRAVDLYDRERINLGTGEITLVGEDGADHE